MKITTLVAAATIATASTTAYAGNPTSVGTADGNVIVVMDPDTGGAATGSMGSLGGTVLPILGGLLLLGAVAAGSGS